MRILSNLPLECFDDRAAMRDVELCTYGPPDRMLVDGVHFPFDVAFDPSRGSWRELADSLPPGFEPDMLLLFWPDQEPLPAGLEDCPVPVVGVVSDYNLTLPYLVGLWPFFDVLLCDRQGQDLFRRLSFGDVRYWCQFAQKRASHRLWPEVTVRDIDVGFAGNLNPIVQRERSDWIERVRGLARRGAKVEIKTGLHGESYGRFLNRCRIGWNRSIRSEMNLRGFEVPACGALLMMERDNLEVRDFFVEDEECVLYGDEDFEDIVSELLADPARVHRIAMAGHRRVQDHRLGNRLHELAALTSQTRPRPVSSEADRVLGRAIAMLPTWADGPTIAAAALAAHELAPDDPRTLNLLGLATLRWRGAAGGEAAWGLWQRAIATAPDYAPAAVNLAAIATTTDDVALQVAMRDDRDRRLIGVSWADIDGPMLPLGFNTCTVDRSLALQQAVRSGEPNVFAQSLAD